MSNQYYRIIMILAMMSKANYSSHNTENETVFYDPNISLDSQQSQLTNNSKAVQYGDDDVQSELNGSFSEESTISSNESIEQNKELFYYGIGLIDAFKNKTPTKNIEETKELLQHLSSEETTLFDFKMLQYGILSEFNGTLSPQRISAVVDYAVFIKYSDADFINFLLKASFPHSALSFKISEVAAKLLEVSDTFSVDDKVKILCGLLLNPYNPREIARERIEEILRRTLKKNPSISDIDRFSAYIILSKGTSFPDLPKRKRYAKNAYDLALRYNNVTLIKQAKSLYDMASSSIRKQMTHFDVEMEREQLRSPIDSLFFITQKKSETQELLAALNILDDVFAYFIRKGFQMDDKLKTYIETKTNEITSLFLSNEKKKIMDDYFDKHREYPTDQQISSHLMYLIVNTIKLELNK